MHLMLGLGLAAALAATTPAFAESANPCPSGEVARLRISVIKPNGTMAGFNDAVAAHIAWYRSHNYGLTQRVVPVLDVDRTTASTTVSTKEVMTIATGPSVPMAKHDAGWSAFVAKYQENSDVVTERLVCLPKM